MLLLLVTIPTAAAGLFSVGDNEGDAEEVIFGVFISILGLAGAAADGGGGFPPAAVLLVLVDGGAGGGGIGLAFTGECECE